MTARPWIHRTLTIDRLIAVLSCLLLVLIFSAQMLMGPVAVIPQGQGMANIRQFGAVCDGVTDDATAIQSAINQSTIADLWVPAAKCNIGTTLSLKKNLVLHGTGPASILNYTGIGVAIQAVGTLGNHWNTTLRNLRLTSRSASTVGILIKDVSVVTLFNLQIDGETPDSGQGSVGFSVAGIRLQASAASTTIEVKILDNFITQVVGDGVRIDGGVNTVNNITIDHNTIVGNGGWAVNVLNDGVQIAITHNDLEGNRAGHLYLNAQGPFQISGNYFESSAGNNNTLMVIADTRPTQGVTLSGNFFIGNGIGATVNCIRLGKSANLDGFDAHGNGYSSCTNVYNIGAVKGGKFGPERYVTAVTNYIGAIASSATGIHIYPQTTRTVLTYAATMAIDASLIGDTGIFEVAPSNGTAFTFSVPTNSTEGRQLSIRIKNTFGVLGAATFTGGAGGFRLGAAWTQPAKGFSRTITFQYDGTNWIEIGRTATDVSN